MYIHMIYDAELYVAVHDMIYSSMAFEPRYLYSSEGIIRRRCAFTLLVCFKCVLCRRGYLQVSLSQ